MRLQSWHDPLVVTLALYTLQQELGRNYDANAKVIEMMLGRSAAGMKRDAMAKAKAEKPTKRRKGTLLA
jgi:hypothetical protein